MHRASKSLAVVLVLTVLTLADTAGADEKNLLRNGSVRGEADWSKSSSSEEGVRLAVDGAVGVGQAGALFVERPSSAGAGISSWSQIVPAPPDADRLELTVHVRCRDLGPRSFVGVMFLFWKDGEAGWSQIGRTRAAVVTSAAEWSETSAVVQVPEDCRNLTVLAYLSGSGTAWFDDFSLVRTDEEVTRVPSPFPGPSGKTLSGKDDERHWDLIRGCADSIPWVFDLASARTLARKEGKPILAYVRCTSYFDEGLESARNSLRADKIPHHDDGYRKDVLFRAGPLSDPVVSELIRLRFVPLLLTYHFPSQLGAPPQTWWRHYFGDTPLPDAVLRLDAGKGRSHAGSLRVRKDDASERQDGWLLTFELPDALPADLWLKAWVRAGELGSGSSASISVLALSAEGKVLGSTDAGGVSEPCDWSELSAHLKIPPDCRALRVLAWLRGKGGVWFDDFSASTVESGGPNLLPDGGIDPGIGILGHDLVTPAMVVLKPSGEIVRRLHRIGVLSSDHVDAWLRVALREGGFGLETEDLEELSPPDALIARSVIEMRQGRWADALATLDAFEGDSKNGCPDEVVFRRAWCLHRLGRRAEAVTLWHGMVSGTVYGRKAAACLLPNSVKLWLAASERAWPRLDEPGEGTEAGTPGGFSVEQSIRVLLELQHPNGCWGGHTSFERGAVTAGPWVAAITALGAEALWRWRDRVPEGLRTQVKQAHIRAIRFLEGWVDAESRKKEPFAVSAFTYPYVLEHLVRAGEKETAGQVVGLITGSQNEDGSWSIYGPRRPTSFNTAMCILALAGAKQRGHGVPEKFLTAGVKALEKMRASGALFPYSTADGHEWMTTDHGSIARDPLCEHALLAAGKGSRERLSDALKRFLRHAPRLRAPTKKYSGSFNPHGLGPYFFFFAHRNALAAAREHSEESMHARVRSLVREEVRKAREWDGTFLDHFMYGRAYGTAAALCILAR